MLLQITWKQVSLFSSVLTKRTVGRVGNTLDAEVCGVIGRTWRNIASQGVLSRAESPEAPESGTRMLKEQNLNGPDDLNETAMKTEGSASTSAISPRATELGSPVANGIIIGKRGDEVSEEDSTRMNDSFNSELRATVLQCWKQDENSEFSGRLLRIAEVLGNVLQYRGCFCESGQRLTERSLQGSQCERHSGRYAIFGVPGLCVHFYAVFPTQHGSLGLDPLTVRNAL